MFLFRYVGITVVAFFALAGGANAQLAANAPGCYCDVGGQQQLLDPPATSVQCINTLSEWPAGSGNAVSSCAWLTNGPAPASAQATNTPGISNTEVVVGLQGLNKIGGVPLGSTTSTVAIIIGRIVFFFLSIIGSVGLVMFIYAGLLWMFSAGNSEKQKKAMNIMFWAGAGIIAAVGSWGIVRFVFLSFG